MSRNMAFEMFMDESGLPYSDYGVYRGINLGRQRSILAVAERAIWYWNEFLRGDQPAVLLSYDWTKWPVNMDEFRPSSEDEARAMMVNCADWLLANVEARDGFSVWAYPYSFSYETSPGWRSAHTQAVGIQVLCRAAEITRKSDYTKPIPSLLAAFEQDIDNGGLSTRTPKGNIWFEKMADKGNKQPKVLNGLLFAILGLRDIGAVYGYEKATELAAIGETSAIELFPRFDLGNWSAYDAHGKRASIHYHQVHIRQLDALVQSSPKAIYSTYLDRFRSYEHKRLSGDKKVPQEPVIEEEELDEDEFEEIAETSPGRSVIRRTEAEERALVENFHPVVAPPSDPSARGDGAEEECKRAVHRAVFEMLDWDLEDQYDIDEAKSKLYMAADEAGWSGVGREVVDWLCRIHQYPEKRAKFERAVMQNYPNDDDNEMPEDDIELEDIENELNEASQLQPHTSDQSRGS